MALMGLSFVLMPLSGGFVSLMFVALLMGFANGIGSGIVMTLGADVSPSVGRPTFLGLWREFADAGAGIGPVLLSFLTAVASLTVGVVATGCIGFAAAVAMWAWIPKRPADRAGEVRRVIPPGTTPRPDQEPGETTPLS
jgi:MFS family permease